MRNRPTSGTPIRVLHVEDNLRDAKLCAGYLEKAGFKLSVDVVSSPEEFAKALRSTPYDVILAPYRMTAWSGVDALETLRREGNDTPFIFVTPAAGEEIVIECFRKGATDCVLKDRLARLPEAVERALEGKPGRDESARAETTRAQLASLVEATDEAIIGVSLDGAILTWNGGAARIFGYPAEEIRGRPISVLLAGESDVLHRAIESIQRGQRAGPYEAKGARNGGAALDVSLTTAPVRDARGELTGAAMVIRDITEQKRQQSEFVLAQKMEAIGRLAAGVAHDFNNLLTVVMGYSSLLLVQLKEHDPLYTEIREINNAGQRAAWLTRQLQAVGRKHVLQPQVLQLNLVVTEMDRVLRHLIGKKIDLVTILDRKLGFVKADQGQIEQVIMNLAVNARDSMPEGGRLTVQTTNLDLEDPAAAKSAGLPPGSYAMLAVTDTGGGMDAATQARIFEPFFTKGEGMGLGLCTVYGIVEQSGGTILIDSEPGRGTTFKIYLPRVQELAGEAARETAREPAFEKEPAAISSKPSETILVVEDEDAVRGLIGAILRKQGYMLLSAKNGNEALLLCDQHAGKIDLMITDLVMPSMTGSELAVRLESLRPDTKVLFMSGYTDTAIAEHGVLNPNIAFVEKPFAPTVLARRVREILDAEQH